MTKDEILNAKTPEQLRALDAFIYENVMGWTGVSIGPCVANYSPHPQAIGYRPGAEFPLDLPFIATSLSGAQDAIDAFAEKHGCDISIVRENVDRAKIIGAHWYCQIRGGDLVYPTPLCSIMITNDSPALAVAQTIAVAALENQEAS